MDKERIEFLQTEIAFQEKGIFFTERAMKDERPGGHMSQQLERINAKLTEMRNELKGLLPKKAKKKRNGKKRR